jgi:hypothetical protein
MRQVFFVHWKNRNLNPGRGNYVVATTVGQAANDEFWDPDNFVFFSSSEQPLLASSPIPTDGIVLWASSLPQTQTTPEDVP